MSEPMQPEPPQPAPSEPEPMEPQTPETAPEGDPGDTEEESDEESEPAEPATPDGEPPPEQLPSAQLTERQHKARLKKLDEEATRHNNAISEILGEDAQFLE